MRTRVHLALLLVVALVGLGAVVAPPVQASDGPKVTLSVSEAAPGDKLLVSMSGFVSPAVAIAVCGNLARRGSADCAMASSQGKEIDDFHAVTLAELTVQAPPMPCPCLVRVTSTNGDEFGVAPLVVTGHPSGPIVGPPNAQLVEVKVSTKRADDGVLGTLRAALGGKTTYAVTASVRNITTETLSNIQLRGVAANRWSDQLAQVPLDPPGPLDAGQTFTKTVDVELPAPMFGEVRWTVTAFGAGPSVTTTAPMSVVPWLLYLLIVVFVGDAVALVWRLRKKRAARRAAPTDRSSSPDGEPDLERMWAAPSAAESELTAVGRG